MEVYQPNYMLDRSIGISDKLRTLFMDIDKHVYPRKYMPGVTTYIDTFLYYNMYAIDTQLDAISLAHKDTHINTFAEWLREHIPHPCRHLNRDSYITQGVIDHILKVALTYPDLKDRLVDTKIYKWFDMPTEVELYPDVTGPWSLVHKLNDGLVGIDIHDVLIVQGNNDYIRMLLCIDDDVDMYHHRWGIRPCDKTLRESLEVGYKWMCRILTAKYGEMHE